MIKYLKDVIICNNFYPNPDGVRDYALRQEYDSDDRKKNWPGRDSVHEHVDPETTMAISHIVGEPLYQRPENKCSYFRITREGESGRQNIHFDPNPGLVWAGVCYLTPTERTESGTKFWKHKELGWERSPNQKQAEESGINSHKDMLNFFETDGLDESKWTETLNVPFSYNRLILFRPWLFHCGGIPFGTTNEDSRLVQLFFYYNDEPKPKKPENFDI